MATAKKRPKRKRAPAPPPRRRTRKVSTPPGEATVEVAPPPITEVPEAAGLPLEPEPAPAIESASELDLPLTTPEVAFADRVILPEAERPYPASRRAIFFDVENTSRAQHIARVIEHLKIDRLGHRTEFFAVGNWRVIGHDTARLLARHGADLVHSAPSVGVRDWSDLRIAVAAGAWLAAARPGDVIEIVSDDRAFDAVGDVAAGLGITFHRLSYRGLAGAPAEEAPAAPEREAESRPAGERRSHRYRGRYRGRHEGRRAPEHAAPPPPPPPPAPPRETPPAVESVQPAGEPHTAPHDEIIHVVRDLVRANPGRTVSIDAVANALKARGFSRPPGSPRLITRLRRLKEIELSRSGLITLVDSSAAPVEEPEPPTEEEVPKRPPDIGEPPSVPAPAEPLDVEEDDEGPQPGNEKVPSPRPATTTDNASGQRRWRRGGRRWRGGGRPHAAAAP